MKYPHYSCAFSAAVDCLRGLMDGLSSGINGMFWDLLCSSVYFFGLFYCFVSLHWWQFGLYQRDCAALGPVSTRIGNGLKVGKPSRCIASHSAQLSLAIPLSGGAVSTSKSWGVNRHVVWYLWSRSVSQTPVWLRANEAEISAALWAHVAQEGLSFLSQGLCFASLH